MYEHYNIRPELLKSRQFYNNAFDTSVNYEDLMALKQEREYPKVCVNLQTDVR